jgi:hypothetical protein
MDALVQTIVGNAVVPNFRTHINNVFQILPVNSPLLLLFEDLLVHWSGSKCFSDLGNRGDTDFGDIPGRFWPAVLREKKECPRD